LQGIRSGRPLSTNTAPDQVVDTSGLLCPVPIIRAKQAIDKLSSGQVLQLIATDPGSKADIPGWARALGHTVLATSSENGKFTFLVRKR
jgi:TusA-related sulfurtransferase